MLLKWDKMHGILQNKLNLYRLQLCLFTEATEFPLHYFHSSWLHLSHLLNVKIHVFTWKCIFQVHQSVKELLECAKCAKTLILSRTDTIPFPIDKYKENKLNLLTQILKLRSLQIISLNINLLFVLRFHFSMETWKMHEKYVNL